MVGPVTREGGPGPGERETWTSRQGIPPEEPKNEIPEEKDSGSQGIYSAEESLNIFADEKHRVDPTTNNDGAAEQVVAASEPTLPRILRSGELRRERATKN